MSRSVNLSASPPQQGATISHFYKQRIFEKEQWKDATRTTFTFWEGADTRRLGQLFFGPFLWVDKKRCQRQIIYFCRRSVIKVFAPTGFLWPPITVEIIIIGPQSVALLSMTKNAKKDLSVGNVLRANIGGNKKNILRLSQEHCVLFDMKLSFSIHWWKGGLRQGRIIIIISLNN